MMWWFVPIANEFKFFQILIQILNDGAGTLVSIKALSTNRTANSSGELIIQKWHIK